MRLKESLFGPQPTCGKQQILPQAERLERGERRLGIVLGGDRLQDAAAVQLDHDGRHLRLQLQRLLAVLGQRPLPDRVVEVPDHALGEALLLACGSGGLWRLDANRCRCEPALEAHELDEAEDQLAPVRLPHRLDLDQVRLGDVDLAPDLGLRHDDAIVARPNRQAALEEALPGLPDRQDGEREGHRRPGRQQGFQHEGVGGSIGRLRALGRLPLVPVARGARVGDLRQGRHGDQRRDRAVDPLAACGPAARRAAGPGRRPPAWPTCAGGSWQARRRRCRLA